MVNGTCRKMKPAKLLRATTTAIPISDKYIQDKKEGGKAAKVIDSLFRNAEMTPEEAKEAIATVNEL
jgi:hypothetical protein